MVCLSNKGRSYFLFYQILISEDRDFSPIYLGFKLIEGNNAPHGCPQDPVRKAIPLFKEGDYFLREQRRPFIVSKENHRYRDIFIAICETIQ